MSFSSSVKNELAKIKVEDICDVNSELGAFVPTCGTLSLRHGEIHISFNTENAAIARRIFTFLKRYYSSDVDVLVSKSKQLKKYNNYSVLLNDASAARSLLYDVEFISGENVFIKNYSPKLLLKEDSCKRAYIRGAFLGAGSISNPERYYHVEFITSNIDHGKFLSELINSYGFNSKIIKRKDYFIVYIKEADQISDLLSLMGASKATLKFENVRVFKDLNNQVNRIVNLENANLNKIVNTSVKQVMDIELIEKKIGINSLPKNLQEVAKIRLSDDTLSLKEIGERINPPIGKSGVNHRMNKIKEIASKLRSE